MTTLSPRAAIVLCGLVVLSACGETPQRAAPFDAAASRPAPRPVAPPPSALGPVLNADGSCSAPNPGTAAAIETGIGECDLVRIKGKPPTDVLLGESGKGQREVQVLYAEPGGRELYFFTDNKLTRIVKPTAG